MRKPSPLSESPSYDNLAADLRVDAKQLLWSSLEELEQLARNPEFRNDPDCNKPYLRLDALDAFLNGHACIHQDLLRELTRGFESDKSRTEASSTDVDLSNLSLVDADELELSVAITRIVERAENALKEALFHVELRLEELSLLLSNGINPNGLHPDALYKPFQEAVLKLDIDAQAKVMLCQIFDQILSAKLRSFYERANQLLANGGILGTDKALQQAIRAHASMHAPSNSGRSHQPPLDSLSTAEFFAPLDTQQWMQGPPAGNTGQAANSPLGSRSNECFLDVPSLSALQQYFNSETPHDPIGRPANRKVATRPTNKAVVSVLTQVQRQHWPEALDPLAIKKELKRSLTEAAQAAGKGAPFASSVSATEEKIIDFVNQIFNTIFDDEILTDAVKALILKLQIPIIKLALLDFSFFQTPEYPARQLLNELVRIGVTIENKQEPLFKKLHNLINGILDDFDTDVSVFEQALKRLKKLDYIETEQARELEQQTLQEAQADAHRSAAKRKVVATLNRHLKNKDLPGQATDFILKCWAPYMGMIYLRHGTDSEDWKHSVFAMRQIIESAQPARTRFEVEQILGNADNFFDQIHQQLSDSSCPLEHQHGILANTREWLHSLIERVSSKPVVGFDDEQPELKDRVDPRDGETASVVELLLPEEEEQDEQEIELQSLLSKIPAEVRPGAWFEIFRGEDRARRRLKLSTVLEETGQVLFADRSGQGILEIELNDFLEDLRDGRTKLIDDNNRFDLALSTVINNIRENQEKHIPV